MKKLALVILLAIGTGSAMAQEVYGQIGSEGLGLGYTKHLNKLFNARGELNHFSMSYTTDSGDNSYKGRLKLGGLALLGDYFPLQSPFRLTAGVVANKGELSATATPAVGTYTFNGVAYAATSSDKVSGKIKFGDVSPYLGIGYGHASGDKPGFSFFADVGVIFQRPAAELSVQGNIRALVTDADIAEETRKLQDSADKFRNYPVIKLGVAYRF